MANESLREFHVNEPNKQFMEKTFHPIALDRKELSDMHLQIRRMCHDLNAPIRAIHGFAEILQRREAAQLSERGNMYLQRMVAATNTMEQVVSRLHQYARLATHPVKLKSVSIAQFTGEIIAAHYRNLPAGASLQWQADRSLVWPSDPVLLETMLRELLDNALLYTKAESPAQVNVAWCVEQDRLLLTVSDAGIGIDPEYHQRVFDLFERLHSRDQFPGAGTGLTMMLKAVSLLGGAIALASAVDLGTTVQISLPKPDGADA
jgi:light-regulated signal transduction histidine kinase (bacteriophytochrome)